MNLLALCRAENPSVGTALPWHRCGHRYYLVFFPCTNILWNAVSSAALGCIHLERTANSVRIVKAKPLTVCVCGGGFQWSRCGHHFQYVHQMDRHWRREKGTFVVFICLRQGLAMWSWLAWNSLCNPSWPQICSKSSWQSLLSAGLQMQAAMTAFKKKIFGQGCSM